MLHCNVKAHTAHEQMLFTAGQNQTILPTSDFYSDQDIAIYIAGAANLISTSQVNIIDSSKDLQNYTYYLILMLCGDLHFNTQNEIRFVGCYDCLDSFYGINCFDLNFCQYIVYVNNYYKNDNTL